MESSLAKPSLTHSLLVLGARLGSGAFGDVYQAHWGNQPCAAKKFFLSQSDFHQQAIQKEIAVLQKLRYRHVIQFYRTHQENDKIYLLMELAEKGSLERAIVKGELAHDDWATKTRLAHEIAQGLAFIHQEKVLHRDLKSANVLLTKHMEVKLADFGLAQVRSAASTASLASNASSTGVKGTLRWIAPELLYAKKAVYSAKSDVYALGVVMWEMAADCTRPFKDQHNEALVALDVTNGRREQLPEDTPAKYREWVERCWAQDPKQRPNASDIVLVHEEPVEESPSNSSSFLDLGSSDITWSRSLSTFDLKGEDIQQQQPAMPQRHEDYVNRLPKTDDAILAYFCAAAETQNTDAQLFLGWIFGHGRAGVAKSELDSLWWYQQAAEGGHLAAQLYLARSYESGSLGLVGSDAAKAAMWYRQAADKGSAEAQLALAKMYTEGHGVGEDTVEAARWYLLAADQGQAEAQATLGQWYSLGRGVTQSDVEALKWLTKAAEQGHAVSQRRLGQMYQEGPEAQLLEVAVHPQHPNVAKIKVKKRQKIVEQSDAKAFEWFTKAAVQGDAIAQDFLGIMYAGGRGVQKDDFEAVKWFSKAAEHGNANAQANFAAMYSEGRGVPKSDVDAVKWIIKSAELGNLRSQGNLGRMYYQGRSVEQNNVEAFKWYIKAAEQGNADAQNGLGVMYRQGQGVEQSDAEAFKWFAQAAIQGDADAQGNLGKMYHYGYGVEKNESEALKWYKKGAAHGSAEAQASLALLYEYGQDIKQDKVEAFKWYSKAAAQGHSRAQLSLALMHKHGHGTKQDEMEGLFHFIMAMAQGDSFSQLCLGIMSDKSEDPQRNPAAAAQFYTKAAAQGEPNAQFSLGELYHLGRGVEQNDAEAIKWFRKSSAQRNRSAQCSLAFMYELGIACGRKYDEALRLYREAAKGEGSNASLHIQWLASRDYGDGRTLTDADEIFKLYCKGAQKGYVAAQHGLGWMYENGRGVAKDKKQAMKWYREASEKHSDSKKRLDFLKENLDK